MCYDDVDSDEPSLLLHPLKAVGLPHASVGVVCGLRWCHWAAVIAWAWDRPRCARPQRLASFKLTVLFSLKS